MLTKVMSKLPDFYDKDELAYLALTGKCENSIRDTFAFEIQKLSYPSGGSEPNQLVAREWKTIDLAILGARNHEPKLLCEFKMTFVNFLALPQHTKSRNLVRQLLEDMNKPHYKKDYHKITRGILLLFHVKDRPRDDSPTLKDYYNRINNSVSLYTNMPNEMEKKADKEIREIIKSFGKTIKIVKINKHNVGNYFGARVAIKMYLLKNC